MIEMACDQTDFGVRFMALPFDVRMRIVKMNTASAIAKFNERYRLCVLCRTHRLRVDFDECYCCQVTRCSHCLDNNNLCNMCCVECDGCEGWVAWNSLITRQCCGRRTCERCSYCVECNVEAPCYQCGRDSCADCADMMCYGCGHECSVCHEKWCSECANKWSLEGVCNFCNRVRH